MKECVILAGGLGTRLQTVVKDVPKCMAEVAGKPFLYYILKYLERQQASHVILALGYKSEVVLGWLVTNRFQFDISWVIEEEALGTGGAIRFAASKLIGEWFFVINGDTYFDVNMDGMETFHMSKIPDISVALRHMDGFDRYGSVSINEEKKIIGFREKQFCESGFINGGIYFLNKIFFQKEYFGEKFSFEKDILENKSLNLDIYGYQQDGYFIDIGIPSDFEKANKDFIDFGR